MFIDLNAVQGKIPPWYREFSEDWATITNLSQAEWDVFGNCAVARFRVNDGAVLFLSVNLTSELVFASMAPDVSEITKSPDNMGYIVKFTDSSSKELRYTNRTVGAHPDII